MKGLLLRVAIVLLGLLLIATSGYALLQDSTAADSLLQLLGGRGVRLADKVTGWPLPASGGLCGVLLHLWIRWREKRVHEPRLTFLSYALAPRRTFVHLLSFLIVMAWLLDLSADLPMIEKPLSLRRFFPFHWFGGLLLGLFSDFILKHLAKKFPTFGKAIGARPSGPRGSVTFQQEAVPPPPGFDGELEGSAPPPRGRDQ